MLRNACVLLASAIGLSILLSFWNNWLQLERYDTTSRDLKEICINNAVTKQKICRPNCYHMNGFFSLPGMKACHPYLTCKDYNDLKADKLIGNGFVKEVFLATWETYEVALNKRGSELYQEDFEANIERHLMLNPSKFISLYIGMCNNSYITEYYPLGNVNNFENLLTDKLSYMNNAETRFSLCIDYVQILNFLHNHPRGTFLTCDSNSVRKIGLQYLLTNDFHLVLNDLDSIPLCNKSGIVCGHRQLRGDLIAPEQIWQFRDKPFNAELMPPYDEKIDIWRIPDVCEYFLSELSDILRFSLIGIHKKCKLPDPALRPSAAEVLDKYLNIFNEVVAHL